MAQEIFIVKIFKCTRRLRNILSTYLHVIFLRVHFHWNFIPMMKSSQSRVYFSSQNNTRCVYLIWPLYLVKQGLVEGLVLCLQALHFFVELSLEFGYFKLHVLECLHLPLNGWWEAMGANTADNSGLSKVGLDRQVGLRWLLHGIDEGGKLFCNSRLSFWVTCQQFQCIW